MCSCQGSPAKSPTLRDAPSHEGISSKNRAPPKSPQPARRLDASLPSGALRTALEEVVQETAIGLARGQPDFGYDLKVCRCKTWSLRLARWRIENQLRKRPRGGRTGGSGTGAAARAAEDSEGTAGTDPSCGCRTRSYRSSARSGMRPGRTIFWRGRWRVRERIEERQFQGGVFKTLAERRSRRRQEADCLGFPPVRLLTSAATSRF
jgi:DNA-directed RNA polymerase specialized sigma24 family protein